MTGTPDEIIKRCMKMAPEVQSVIDKCLEQFPIKKRMITPYQAAPLYVLTKELQPRLIVELGTFHGFTAGIMANAARRAKIITCNPKAWEVEVARKCLELYQNVEVVEEKSWDILGKYDNIDMVFVDGDHAQIVRDLPWWNHINVGGLFFHHDYTPEDAETKRRCPVVYEALNEFAEYLGHGPDVEIIDNEGLGMAGFYKLTSDKDVEVKQVWAIGE